jgi:hypothetical protein
MECGMWLQSMPPIPERDSEGPWEFRLDPTSIPGWGISDSLSLIEQT